MLIYSLSYDVHVSQSYRQISETTVKFCQISTCLLKNIGLLFRIKRKFRILLLNKLLGQYIHTRSIEHNPKMWIICIREVTIEAECVVSSVADEREQLPWIRQYPYICMNTFDYMSYLWLGFWSFGVEWDSTHANKYTCETRGWVRWWLWRKSNCLLGLVNTPAVVSRYVQEYILWLRINADFRCWWKKQSLGKTDS